MKAKRKRDAAVIVTGLGCVAIAYFAWNSDATKRHALVGKWTCAPYFSSSVRHLTFLRGSYAEFDESENAVEHGTWDVWHGRLIEINSSGGSDWSLLRVSFPGDSFELLDSKGAVRASCREQEP